MPNPLENYFRSIPQDLSKITPAQLILKNWAHLFLHGVSQKQQLQKVDRAHYIAAFDELEEHGLFFCDQNKLFTKMKIKNLFIAIFENDTSSARKIIESIPADEASLQSYAIFSKQINPLALCAKLSRLEIFSLIRNHLTNRLPAENWCFIIKLFETNIPYLSNTYNSLPPECQYLILKQLTNENKLKLLRVIASNCENPQLFWVFDNANRCLLDIAREKKYSSIESFLLDIANEEQIQQTVNREFNGASWAVTGVTPLMACVTYARLDLIQVLVERSQTPLDAVDSDDMTALSWACHFGSEQIVLYLLEKGAKINERNSLYNDFSYLEQRDELREMSDLEMIAKSENPWILQKINYKIITESSEYLSIIYILALRHSDILMKTCKEEKPEEIKKLQTLKSEYENLIAHIIFHRSRKKGEINDFLKSISNGPDLTKDTPKYLNYCESWVHFARYEPSLLKKLFYSNPVLPKFEADTGRLLVLLYNAAKQHPKHRETFLCNVNKSSELKKSGHSNLLISECLAPELENTTLRSLCLLRAAKLTLSPAEAQKIPPHISKEELPALRNTMK